ncbi:MAG: peroxide stress protein YaaA, partial [Kocuria rhizophila]|nr:peroxide stress protein YaaA [Kocuria rhizophila]
MLILLPPSESKTAPASGDPLDLASLDLPALTGARSEVADALAAVSEQPDALAVLGAGPSLADDVARNRRLRTAPAAPAMEVY